MDWLRSCYSVQAVFTADGTSLVDTIDWRFVDRDRHVLFPGRHVFGSLNWTRNRFGWPAAVLGESPTAPRPYSKGADPLMLAGTSHCGEDSWYIDGVPAPLHQVPLDFDGLIACCSGQPPQPYDAMPPKPAPSGGHMADYTGAELPALDVGIGVAWQYDQAGRGNTYFWQSIFDVSGVQRRCQSRWLKVTNFFRTSTVRLRCLTYNPDTGVSTWDDPGATFLPAGQWVTVFPPAAPSPFALEGGGLLLLEGGGKLLTEGS